MQGALYFVVFVDDASGYKMTYLLKKKTDFIGCIRFSLFPKVLGTDQAGEMCGGEVQEFYSKHKIWHETSAPHEHSQNPRAESAIGT
eukprot:3819383-Rhodomonas_salina.1